MDFRSKDYKIFELFREKWALVCAGNLDHYNACTVAWGSLGTFWTRSETEGNLITVYLHPARYTQEFFRNNDTFTVGFFPESCRKALGYMGTHSGRTENKAKAAGLTPLPVKDAVYFEEAEMTFVCKKLYAHQFSKEDLAPEICEYYRSKPGVYPVDENGEWQPHWVFVGEITGVIEPEQKA